MTDQQQRHTRFVPSRRQVLAGTMSLGFIHGSGLAKAGPAETLRFGLTPVFLSNDIQLLEALRSYLEGATGYSVELVTRRTYQEVTSLLVSGQLHAAWICGYPYIQFKDALDLVAIPEWNGKPLYQSYLIVAQDRAIDGVSGLRGDIHAFSDPDSNSGYLVTRALMHDLGLDPNRFFRKTLFTYGHRNVIRAVAANLAQSGSVDGYVWEAMSESEPELVARTKVLRRSEWLGFPPVATSKRFADTEMVRSLGQALIGMPTREGGQAVLDLLKLSGFATPADHVFDSIEAMVSRLRGIL